MKIKYASHPLLTGYDTADRTYWQDGEIVDQLWIRKPNGKRLSVQPDGSYQEREPESPIGTYESVSLSPDLNVFEVTPRVARYKIPYVEV